MDLKGQDLCWIFILRSKIRKKTGHISVSVRHLKRKRIKIGKIDLEK